MRGDEPSREAALTIRLFGGMSIRDSMGKDYLPRSRKTRAMVAVLTLTAPRPVSRVRLTGLLWSQREKEQARASLRQSVHELQETLGVAWNRILTAERHHLSLEPRGVTVDVLAATCPAAPKGALLSLLREGFLEDLTGLDPAFDEWLLKERRRLQGMARLAGLSLLRDSQEGEDTIATARSLLRIDPAHDAAWRALIQAHADMSDRPAALFACEQWRGSLLGETPPPDMLAFLTHIQAGSDKRPNSVQDTGPDPGEPPSLPKSIHTGLRLGVREMRLIGANADTALAAGLAEELTTALSRFRWISCVSGASLAMAEGEAGQSAARGSENGLDMVLDGTIQHGGDRVRITARLLDMRLGGAVIWANRFDRAATDTMTIQDEVGAAIVAQVEPVLLMREGERAGAGISGISPASLVLKAVPAIYRLDRSSFHAAGDLLETALRADPTLAVGHAWFAYWHLFLVGQGWACDPDAAAGRAAVLADTAVALDPNDARALTLAGHVRGFLMKRPSEAAVLHERALSLNPNLAIAWCFSGLSHTYLGEHETAIARIRQAIQLSPSDPHLFFFGTSLMIPHLMRGEYAEAAAAGREAIELNPWFSSSFKVYLCVLGLMGRAREAAHVRARLLKLEPGFTVRDAVRRGPMLRPEDIARYAEGLRLAGLPEE